MDGLHISTSGAGIAIKGSTDLTKDKPGLAATGKLQADLREALAHHPTQQDRGGEPASLGIDPFQNESDAISIGQLNIENRTDRVAVYGTLHVTNDHAGFMDASKLAELLTRIADVLKADPALPDAVTIVVADTVPNPFM